MKSQGSQKIESNLFKRNKKALKWQERFFRDINEEKLKRDIGKYLTEWCQRQDMRQENIATALNVSKSTVGKWERSESLPPLYKIIALSELSGDSLDSILLGRTPMVEKAISDRLKGLSPDNKERLLKIIDTVLEVWKNT